MPVAHLNGTELFYVEIGEGLPCLVMHGGLGFDHIYMHPWLDPLGDVMHLVYYDHRGNGRSGRPPWATLAWERLCADADALRGHLGFEKVAVIGHLQRRDHRPGVRAALAGAARTTWPPGHCAGPRLLGGGRG